MPKIKLSPLVSDIKGKANGGVFARNKGGLYYRNNPSGGGQKTAAWAKVKGKFSNLSGLWRGLSPAQKATWNESVDNFNRLNVFGDKRIPSGYELFMSLNGPLQNLDLPINETAPSPQGFPDLGINTVTTVNGFLYTPEVLYAPQNCWDRELEGILYWLDIWNQLNPKYGMLPDGDDIITMEDATPNTPFIFNINVGFTKFSFGTDDDPENAVLLRPDDNKVGWFVRVRKSGPGVGELIVSLEDGSADNEVVFNFGRIVFSKIYNLTVSFDMQDLENSKLFIDGVAMSPSSFDATSFPSDLSLIEMKLDNRGEKYVTPVAFNNISFGQLGLSDEELYLLNRNYLIFEMDYIFTFNPQRSNAFINLGRTNHNEKYQFAQMYDTNKSFPKYNKHTAPVMHFLSENPIPSEFVLALETSPMGSPGRGGNRSGYKRIGSFKSDNSVALPIGDAFVSQFGYVLNNSHIQTRFSLINTNTGEKSALMTSSFDYLQPHLLELASAGCGGSGACGSGYQCVGGVCVTTTWGNSLIASYPHLSKGGGITVSTTTEFKAGSELAKSVN